MKNLLIVDDEPYIIDMFSRYVSKYYPCTIFKANHGVQALQMIKTHKIDLVILDMNMPVMDGLETIETLRTSAEYASFRNLPVIVVTALYADDIQRKFKKFECCDFYSKLDIVDQENGQNNFKNILGKYITK